MLYEDEDARDDWYMVDPEDYLERNTLLWDF